jgi:4-methyl-5(b-hydroxyethyl)-thiazole monophosphate biosynthesis
VARVLIPLAPGFEEIEAVSTIDVLRRADVEVVVAAVGDSGSIAGSHGIAVRAEVRLRDVRDQDFDAVILPGGEPGVTNLDADPDVDAVLERQARAGRPMAAICAAPRLLAHRGLLRGRDATSHPSVESHVRAGGATYDDVHRVVRDGMLLTSRGPGTAIEFALETLEMLGLGARAAELRRAMLVAAPD